MTGAPQLPYPGTTGYAGAAWLQTGGSSTNAISFLVRQIIAGKAFAALVKVIAVSGGGVGTPPVATVQPMVNQIDGFGNQTAHGPIYNIPCFRLQGGTSAVIVDPAVGDIGEAIICDRDISTVKATGRVSGPGSRRQHDWADGCYFGGFLNGAPTTYVHVSAAGINLVTPMALTFQAANAVLDDAGNLAVAGDVTAGMGGADSVTLQMHQHGTGSAAAGTTPPTPGT